MRVQVGAEGGGGCGGVVQSHAFCIDSDPSRMARRLCDLQPWVVGGGLWLSVYPSCRGCGFFLFFRLGLLGLNKRLLAVRPAKSVRCD